MKWLQYLVAHDVDPAPDRSVEEEVVVVPEDVPGGVEVAGEDAGEVEEAPLLHVDGGTGLDLAGCLCNQNTVLRRSD